MAIITLFEGGVAVAEMLNMFNIICYVFTWCMTV